MGAAGAGRTLVYKLVYKQVYKKVYKQVYKHVYTLVYTDSRIFQSVPRKAKVRA